MPSIKEGRLLTREEADQIIPSAFDIDGDGSIATNSYWLTAQQFPATNNLKSSLRTNSTLGSGKTILFFTRLNNQWINFTSDLRLALEAEGYNVLVQNDDQPLQDLSNIDVLAIINSLGTPFAGYNDRPLSLQDKNRILNFISSGKGFFFSGDWNYSELSKYNDIADMFGATMSANEIDYMPIYENGYVTTYSLPYTWHAYVFDFVNFYQTSPSQPIFKRAPLYGYSSFSNADHDIFENVNEVLLLGSSHMKPKYLPIEAGVKTHPTTSRPWDYPVTPEGYPLIIAKNYGSGRVVLSCDSNCFANDGFATSDLAGTDNRIFAMNLFNWLAKTTSQEVTAIKIKDMTTGNFVDSTSLEMSSLKKTRSFSAIGFSNETELGPVSATWSLIDGDVAPGTLRDEILTELNVNVGKIGIFQTASGAKSIVSNTDQVDFVSYLSSTITGNIKIKANYENLSPVEVSIRLKQPKISIKLNKLDSVSDSLLVPEWKNVVINTWSKESLFFVDFLNSSPDTFSNEILSDPTHLPNSYESNLIYLGKSIPDLEVIITNDTKQNAVYGGRTVFTRQLQTLLSKKRGDPKAIIVTITKSLVNTVIPITPLTPGYPVGGWTSSSRHTYERNISPTKIDDLSEGGITLVNIPYSDTNFSLSDPPIMAHEIGHILIRGENDHLRADGSSWAADNLMNQGATGNKLVPIQWIHALGLDGDVSSFVEEE
jgi:hypothetical protein